MTFLITPYAANYFSFMPFDSVLESRKWHKQTLGCTYAIVALQESAPPAPPKAWLDESRWDPTPLAFKDAATDDRCRNLICECNANWQPSHAQQLSEALMQPGSFYHIVEKRPPHDDINQATIFIYSKSAGVAAQVRFGD